VAEAVGFRAEKWGEFDWRLVTPDGRGTGTLCARAEMVWVNWGPQFTRDMNAWLAWGLPWLSKRLSPSELMWGIWQGETDNSVEVGVNDIVTTEATWEIEGTISDLPLLLCRLVERIVGGDNAETATNA
jgi:hypothetical protein